MKYFFKNKAFSYCMFLFDALGWFFFIFARHSKKISNIKHVLIIRLDHLGDILFATAIPKLLKEDLGVQRVTFLTSSVGAALLRNNPFVDQVIVYDSPWFSRGKKNSSEKNFFGLMRNLKSMKIDLVLSLRGDLRENWLTFVACCRERVGYGVTGGGFLLTHELPYRWKAHEREHTLDILKFIGIERPILEPKIYFSEEEEKLFADKQALWGLGGTTPIGVQLEAGSKAKEWTRENALRFLELSAKKLGRRKLIFIGTDKERFSWVSKFLNDNPDLGWTDLIGKTDVRELLYCIRHLSAFIGPDSGPAHMAASFGMPSLFLYSGSNVFEEWKSLEESAEFLKNPVPCSPCQRLDCPVVGHPCMSGIEPEAVIRWILERTHEK